MYIVFFCFFDRDMWVILIYKLLNKIGWNRYIVYRMIDDENVSFWEFELIMRNFLDFFSLRKLGNYENFI